MSADIINFPTQPSPVDLAKNWDVMDVVIEVMLADRDIERNLLLQKAENIGLELIRKARSYGLDMDNEGRIKR